MDNSRDIQEIELMIEDCINREDKLSEWEASFIDSINGKHKELSPKQRDKLDAIWEKVTNSF
jgi:hypothetical protein